MYQGFWSKLPFPIVGASPMDGVSDSPFRYIAKKYGHADIIYTEFVSAEGLWRLQKKGELDNKIFKDLIFDPSQRPIVAQLFGSDPDSFYQAAQILCNLGFDGIDINMGCPSPGLEKRGGGAGLIRRPALAREIVLATRQAVLDWHLQVGAGQDKELIPVTLKTRIGSVTPDPSWWEFLSTLDMPLIAMHGRTFKELYSGFAHWDLLQEAAKIIRSKGTLFLANGDIQKISQSNDLFNITTSEGKDIDLNQNFDGVLVGRGSIGNPWVLHKDGFEPTWQDKKDMIIEHCRQFEATFPKSQFFPMRKHLAGFSKGHPQASEIRKQLVQANSAQEVADILSYYP